MLFTCLRYYTLGMPPIPGAPQTDKMGLYQFPQTKPPASLERGPVPSSGQGTESPVPGGQGFEGPARPPSRGLMGRVVIYTARTRIHTPAYTCMPNKFWPVAKQIWLAAVYTVKIYTCM